jgi:REP element-mobilizing transposase RayT
VKLFESERFRRDFVDVLRQLREPLGFLLMGWVLMPEHFHLLLPPQPAESTSLRMDRVD